MVQGKSVASGFSIFCHKKASLEKKPYTFVRAVRKKRSISAEYGFVLGW